MKHRLTILLPAVALLVAIVHSPAWACSHCGCNACNGCNGDGHSACADDCGATNSGPAMITKTVYEPQYTTEMRTVTKTGHKTEQQERQSHYLQARADH